MVQQLGMALFWGLFTMAVAWVGLWLWLFRRLRIRHPDVYEAIGCPSLFHRNYRWNVWSILGFLYGSRWKGIGDFPLAVVMRLMQIWFVAQLLGFSALIFLVATGRAR